MPETGLGRSFVERLITTIMLSNGVSITTDVIRMALEKDVDIIFLDYLEKPIGRVWNNKFGSSAKIRISQIEFFNNKKGKMASQKWILNKLVMQKKHIDKLLSRRKKIDDIPPHSIIDGILKRIFAE